jgi:hypothetical protein
VLAVVGRGADLAAARAVAERAAGHVAWPGMQRRHDIALAEASVAIRAAGRDPAARVGPTVGARPGS